MTSSIVRTGVDTWTWSTKPAKNFHKGGLIRLKNGEKRGWLRFKSPAPAGATVLSAKLVLTQVDAVAGSVQITAQRAADGWQPPQINWNNQPGVTGAATSLTKASPAAGTLWEIDVTDILQAIVNGSTNHGVRLTTDSGDVKFYSLNAAGRRPYLSVVWSTAPQQPTKLAPSYGIVGEDKPVVSCDYTDRSGSTDLNAIQVQTDASSSGFGAPDWDSGAVATDEPQLDLAGTSFPGLVSGVPMYWRVRVQDGDGLWSAWSDPAVMTYRAKGVVTITNPPNVASPTVTEFTPPIGWSFSVTQTHYRVLITPAANPKKILWDTEKVKGTDNSVTVPKKILKDDTTYRVVVQLWDNYPDRERTTGSPVYSEATREFVVDYDPTVDGALTMGSSRPSTREPWIDLVFTRASAPDTWTIMRDGVAIETDVEPADIVDLDGITYRWRDYDARPEVPHVYRVRAEVNGKLSSGGPTTTITPSCVGVWLLDPTTKDAVLLGGKDIDAASVDLAETFDTIGAVGITRSVMGIGGLAGSVDSLMLRNRPGRPWEIAEALLYDFKSRPTDEFRLIWGDMNIPVVLGNLTIRPHPDTLTGDVRKAVSFEWWQVDEFAVEGI